jgi:hypothetical protein
MAVAFAFLEFSGASPYPFCPACAAAMKKAQA